MCQIPVRHENLKLLCYLTPTQTTISKRFSKKGSSVVKIVDFFIGGNNNISFSCAS